MEMKDEIQKIIENSHNEIVTTVKEELKRQVIDSLTYNFRNEISKIVADYIKDNLADDIKKMLDNEKENMLAEIQKSCVTIAAEVGKKMIETATNNLTSSYKSESIVKKIFE